VRRRVALSLSSPQALVGGDSVVLRATHQAALTYCSLSDLKRFAVDLA